MTEAQLRKILHQCKLEGRTPPDAFWMSEAEADELVRDVTGDPTMAFSEATTIYDIPIHVFEVSHDRA